MLGKKSGDFCIKFLKGTYRKRFKYLNILLSRRQKDDRIALGFPWEEDTKPAKPIYSSRHWDNEIQWQVPENSQIPIRHKANVCNVTYYSNPPGESRMSFKVCSRPLLKMYIIQKHSCYWTVYWSNWGKKDFGMLIGSSGRWSNRPLAFKIKTSLLRKLVPTELCLGCGITDWMTPEAFTCMFFFT